jgi:hypothetical protein
MTTFLKFKSSWIDRDSIVSVAVITRSDNGERLMRVGLANGGGFSFMGEELEAMADYLAFQEEHFPEQFVDVMAFHEAAAEETRRAEPAHQLLRLAETLKGRFPMLRAWVTGNGNRLVLLRNGFHAVVVAVLPEGGFGVTMSEKKVEAGMDFYFGPEKRVVGRDAAFDRVVSLVDGPGLDAAANAIDTIIGESNAAYEESASDPGPQSRKFFL